MKLSVLCAVLAVPAFAADFTLEIVEGEIKKGSITATYVVRDDSVTLTIKDDRKTGRKPTPAPKTTKLTNAKELDAALAEIRSTSEDDPNQPRKFFEYKNGCLREGENAFCTAPGSHNASRLEALEKLEQLLIAELKGPLEFTLESESGEMSRDASSAKATYVVRGNQVTYTTKHSGRQAFPEDDDPPKVVKLSNMKELEPALAAIRATKDDKKEVTLINTRYRTACLLEGKKKLCSTVKGEETTPRLDAIGKLEQLLLMEVMK